MMLGVTGTRWGWTEKQEGSIRAALYLNSIRSKFLEFHHGLCQGVDTQMHNLIRELYLDVKIVGHPSIDKTHEIASVCDEMREPLGHFARNRVIVNETTGLLVVPYQMEHQNRGGTWYTHDYAKRVGKPVLIFWPDGSTSQFTS